MPLEETKRRRGTGGALHETMVKKLSNDVSQHGCLGKFKKCQREIRGGEEFFSYFKSSFYFKLVII